MAKNSANNPIVKTLRWPTLGLRESHPQSQPPPELTSQASGNVYRDFYTNPGTVLTLNCRTFDPLTDRKRGARRPGLSKLTSSSIGSGVIQDINHVLGLGGILVRPVILDGGASIPQLPTFTDEEANIGSSSGPVGGSPYSDALANTRWTAAVTGSDATAITLAGSAPTTATASATLTVVNSGANHNITVDEFRHLLKVTLPGSVTGGPVASAVFSGLLDWSQTATSLSTGLQQKPAVRLVFSTNGTNWTTWGEFRVPGGTVSGTVVVPWEGWPGPTFNPAASTDVAFSVPLPFVPTVGATFMIGVMLTESWNTAATSILPTTTPGVGQQTAIDLSVTLHDFAVRLYS